MGFKKTSEPIAISFGQVETGPNSFVQTEIALQLDVLNNEIFVVLAVDLDNQTPDGPAAPGGNSSVASSVTSTSKGSVSNIGVTNCIASAEMAIRGVGTSGVGFTRGAMESYTGDLAYIALIATNNFFIQLAGSGNVNAKGMNGRLWGYRARADSSTYAALVQSEVLSA